MGEEVRHDMILLQRHDLLTDLFARYKWAPIKARKIVYNPPVSGNPRDRSSVGGARSGGSGN